MWEEEGCNYPKSQTKSWGRMPNESVKHQQLSKNQQRRFVGPEPIKTHPSPEGQKKWGVNGRGVRLFGKKLEKTK